jgi:iron complex outermembrane receptor protein
MIRNLVFRASSAALLLLALQSASAQTPHPTETIVVLGTATPVPLAESPSAVLILPIKEQQLKVETSLDLLREDSSLFLEQRGAGGAQSDIVLRGGSFEQTLVLLNGLRINDAQTSHHNLDLPLPLEAMNQIQVLHGAGSTLHGVDALAGVVDFLTAAPSHSSVLLRAGAGSFGENEQALMAGSVHSPFSGRITADRNFSTGFMTDRDYRNEDASAEGWLGSRLGVTDLLFAGSDRAFGANQFYGPYPEWERTKGWFASIRQELGARSEAAFGYRRHTDDFVLIRDDPSAYENNHIDASWQSQLRRTQQIRQGALFLMGLEADGDSIHSNNLGMHARNRGAGYVDLDLTPPQHRWNLSPGLREEIFSGGAQAVTSPHLAGSWRLASSVKLRASGGYGFRIPTYTDLYYSDPTTIGNPTLKPESAWSGDGGIDWAPAQKFIVSATGFYSRQHDAIDYVRADPAAQWQAENLSGLRFAGVEASTTWKPSQAHTVQVSWTSLYGAQNALHGLESEYIFNYPVNNIHGLWAWAIAHSIVLTNMMQIAQSYQQTAYPVWNASLIRSGGIVEPYLRISNASNTGYQEITGIAMPGRAVVAGIIIRLHGR